MVCDVNVNVRTMVCQNRGICLERLPAHHAYETSKDLVVQTIDAKGTNIATATATATACLHPPCKIQEGIGQLVLGTDSGLRAPVYLIMSLSLSL